MLKIFCVIVPLKDLISVGKNVEIFAVTGGIYGTGHASRMLQLANLLVKLNLQASLNLITDEDNSKFLTDTISKSNSIPITLNTSKKFESNFLRTKSHKKMIFDIGPKLLELHVNLIKNKNCILFDDEGTRMRLPENVVVINPNPRSPSFLERNYQAPNNLYNGIKFLPINTKFKSNSRVRKHVKNILVYPGSGNFDRFWSVLSQVAFNFSNINFNFVGVDKSHFNLSTLAKNITLFSRVSDLVDLVTEADLSVGACGVSFFEKVSNGLPSLVFCSNINQYDDIDFIRKTKISSIIKYPGYRHICSEIEAQVSNKHSLNKMSERCLSTKVFDSLEMTRVIKEKKW